MSNKLKELDDIVLKLARIDADTKDLRQLCLKAKAIGAVSEWLRAERQHDLYMPRLAPV